MKIKIAWAKYHQESDQRLLLTSFKPKFDREYKNKPLTFVQLF